MTDRVRIELGGEAVEADADKWTEVADKLVAKHGGIPKVTPVVDGYEVRSAKPVSTWTEQHIDDSARERIEAQHAALEASGVALDTSQQAYATGTRMADVGYETQTARALEHAGKLALADAAQALADRVRSERRMDVECSAADVARDLAVNGAITVGGHKLTEQAIRGMLARLGSPATGYVLGLRDRCVEAHNAGDRDLLQRTKVHIADTLRTELLAAPDTAFKLRKRSALRDVYAVVSPGYAPADAPEVIDQIVSEMPHEARATFAYDPTSTAWELRADVWTPTPVDEQAVGEAFRGYTSIQSRDNGTSRLRGGGGIELLRCLNATTYVANGADVARVHRGRILIDVALMVGEAAKAAHALCDAWGIARTTAIDVTPKENEAFQDTIVRWWLDTLRSDRELVGVLPGRTAAHAGGLAVAYIDQRRDPERVVKADMAQAWTAYIQNQPAAIRRDAEVAIGSWVTA